MEPYKAPKRIGAVAAADQDEWAAHGEGPAPGTGRGEIFFPELCAPAAVRLTVWCKSLLFNSHGYTVFDDADGRMVFRVENYAHNWREETVLMDCTGNVLLTIRRRRRKILNLTESWEAYKGDEEVERLVGAQRPLFKATKNLGSPSCTISMITEHGIKPLGYRMIWSKNNAKMKIFRSSVDTLVAEVSRKCGSMPKKLLDKDVLTMRLQPGMDQALAMAMIMITDSMR